MKARLSRWSKNQPVFCPPDRSARKRAPFSRTSIGPLISPLAIRTSRVRPSCSRAELSLRSTTTRGSITVSSAASRSSLSRSMPALFNCATTTSP